MRPRASRLRAAPLGVHDPAPGEHPVNVAWANRLHRTEAVAVINLAVEEIGDSRELYVRMGTNVQAHPERQMNRSDVVEKDERSDQTPAHRRQRAAHCEAADVARPRFDDELYRVRYEVEALGIARWKGAAHWTSGSPPKAVMV